MEQVSTLVPDLEHWVHTNLVVNIDRAADKWIDYGMGSFSNHVRV